MIKPSQITNVLDVAHKANKEGKAFYPMFIGHAGVGKSQIIQQWVNEQRKTNPNFGYLDLRLAQYDQTTLTGYPYINKDNKQSFAPPTFWPSSGEGIIVFEELNRSDKFCRNAVMQLLTEKKLNDIIIPDGYFFVGAINPDDTYHDTDALDPAIRDRFVEFDVQFDKDAFVSYIKSKNWHPELTNFIEHVWTFKAPNELTPQSGARYVAPRSLERLNAVETTQDLSQSPDLLHTLAVGCLGSLIGSEYYKYRCLERPVLYKDFIQNDELAFARLKQYNEKETYNGALNVITVEDLLKHNTDDKLIVRVAKIIPKDMGLNMIFNYVEKISGINVESKRSSTDYKALIAPKVKAFLEEHNLMKLFKTSLG